VYEKFPGLNNVKFMKLLARRNGLKLDPRPEKGLVDNWFMQAGHILVTVAFDQDGVHIEAALESAPYDIVAMEDEVGNVDTRDIEKMLKKVVAKAGKRSGSVARELLAIARELISETGGCNG